LTVNSIVRFARSRGILCQGRGSAANSAVCYVLGITSIDPVRSGLLFERFVSAERKEPPDIDVDFEHERREEVIQWVYERYGRDRAALCATVIRYRARGAVREVGKAMGLTDDVTSALASQLWEWSEDGVTEERASELNLNPQDRRLRLTLELARELIGFPRHLSQHPGGFVLTRDRLDDLVPIEPASMKDRQVVEWDKDDIDILRWMKVDVLGSPYRVNRCLLLAVLPTLAHAGSEFDGKYVGQMTMANTYAWTNCPPSKSVFFLVKDGSFLWHWNNLSKVIPLNPDGSFDDRVGTGRLFGRITGNAFEAEAYNFQCSYGFHLMRE
jgi:hypothetical protein